MGPITYESILQRMRETYREKSGHEAEEASDIGIRLRVLAGELYTLERRLLWLEDQMYPQTAAGEYLERHCAQRGLTRKAAARAKGVLTFSRRTPEEYSVSIPAGTVCALGEGGIRYLTTEPCRISAYATRAEAPAEAEEGGSEYNCGPGAVTALVSLPIGVEGVTNDTGFTGGTDPEGDEELRRRLLECCAAYPDGANAAYYRQLALAADGVTSVGVTSPEPGKAAVYLWGTGQAPEPGVIEALQELFREKREPNVQVTVSAAEPYRYNLSLDVKPENCPAATAREQVTQAAAEFFSRLKVGDPVLKSRLGDFIANRCAISNYRFPSSVSDYKGSPEKIPVLGNVTVGDLP